MVVGLEHKEVAGGVEFMHPRRRGLDVHSYK